MASPSKKPQSKKAVADLLSRFVPVSRTAEEQREAELEDREARRRGRYYKGVARRIRHGLLTPDEIAMLREDKARVQRIRESVGG